MKKRLYIAGASEPGFELLDIVRSAGLPYQFAGFYDEYRSGQDIAGTLSELEPGAFFVIAIGNTQVRQRLFEQFTARGLAPATVVHPTSFISPHAFLGAGVVIYPNCSVSLNASIGANVLVNYNCSISHGVQIAPHCNITPGVNLAGNVSVGQRCFIGIGSAAIEKVTICDDVMLGGNSTVTRSLTLPGTYVGSPARLVRPAPGAAT